MNSNRHVTFLPIINYILTTYKGFIKNLLDTRVIIPPKDEDALILGMIYFLEHPTEVIRMSNNARPLIVNRYEQKVVWNALLEEYKSLEENYFSS